MFKDNSNHIERYVQVLEQKFGGDKDVPEKVAAILQLLKHILHDPQKYDHLTPLNQEWTHNEFSDIFSNTKTDDESVDELFRLLSRVAREVTLRLPYVPKEPESLFLSYFEFGKEGLTSEERDNSDFLWASMPKYVAMGFLSDAIEERKQAANTVDGWQTKLEDWEKKVAAHEANLKKYHENYNFVGLSKAFHDMFRKTVAQGRWALFVTCLLGLAMLVPLVTPVFVEGKSAIATALADANRMVSAVQILAFIGLELVLVYFFRIALHNWRSLNAQALQLDLRQSLCAFIEGYAKFAGENAKTAENLSKFEALIFSGLISDPGKLPSTFEGLDAMTRMLKALREKA